MRTLADFKRALTLGTKVHTTFHMDFKGRNEDGTPIYGDKDRGIRLVSIVQSNSVAFKQELTDGKTQDQWLQWPKASECKFPGDNTVMIYETGRDGKPFKVLTYKIVD